MFGIKATLLNLAMDESYVFNRRKKVCTIMFEKTPGFPLINKLRVIHIIESDFNLNSMGETPSGVQRKIRNLWKRTVWKQKTQIGNRSSII